MSEDHLQQFRRQGYTVIEHFLSATVLSALRAEIETLFPSWYQYTYLPRYLPAAPWGGCALDVPFLGEQLNLIAVHPEIIDLVERALGTRNILLAQSHVWGKYTGLESFEQDLHVDFMISSILYPSSEDQL